MNKQVKQRIDQIRRGEVPEGYKKTKAGIVPVEWEEKIGIELFEYIRNGFVGTVSPFYVEKGHKYIQGNNIKAEKSFQIILCMLMMNSITAIRTQF